MKTTKQIELLKKEQGKKIKNDFLHEDSIRVSMPRIKEMLETMSATMEPQTVYPFMNKGYIICEELSKKEPLYFYFQESMEQREGFIGMDVEVCAGDDWIYAFTMYIVQQIEKMEDYYIEYDAFSSPALNIYGRQNDQRNIKLESERIKEHVLKYGLGIIPSSVFFIVNNLLLHPEMKEIAKKDEKKVKNETKKTSATTDDRPVIPSEDNDSHKKDVKSVISLNGIVIMTGSARLGRKIKSRKVQRTSDCWGVRGHYRHLKNGKVIRVNPYEKGPKRNTGLKKAKEYEMG